jgi:molybdopterin-guanine dinucleotide biosynthesis protein A
MTKRAAIILAGGKAKRFQTTNDKWQDKALAELDGKPLLVHAIENIQSTIDEIVVVVNENENRISQYRDVLEKHNIQKTKIVTDLKIKDLSGPLIAILTGLKATTADHCITIPCDAPKLNPKVAEYLFNEIDGSIVAVPMWPNGRLETLLMVLERKRALEITTVLCILRRSHPDDIVRGAMKTLLVSPLGEIKNIDPELKSFININCQEDLSRLIPRQEQGALGENVQLNLGSISTGEIQRLAEASLKLDNSDFLGATKEFLECAVQFENEDASFWAAVSREFEAKSLLSNFEKCGRQELVEEIEKILLKATRNYSLEAKIYEENSCYLLAERAKANKSWCETQIEKLMAR